MADLGYEIKHGKHIAFKHKDKERFTRAKTIGEYYTEERLKERIAEKANTKEHPVKKRVGNIIDIANSDKAKESKGYEFWANKHNLKTMADSRVLMREKGFKSISQLDEFIIKTSDKRQELQDQIKEIEQKMDALSQIMEQVNTINSYREIYKYHKENPEDKAFHSEYSVQIKLYITAATEVQKSYKKMPTTKSILEELDAQK